MLLDCNGLSPPLADIVIFRLSFKVFKKRLLRERFPHPYKWCFVLLPNRCEISQSIPFKAQHPRWHSFPSSIDVGPHNTVPSGPSVLLGTASCTPSHTLIKVVSFFSPTDVGSHNPPFRAQRPRWHSFPSSIDVEPHNPPPSGSTSFLAHRLISTPLDSAFLLAHHPVSGSGTICNSPSPLLTNIVLVGLSLTYFPSKFFER